jgi:acyl-coenzyme A thioesterase PaaI-like protein
MSASDPVVNRALLTGNTCFGCGHENHAGLMIEIVQDVGTPAVLRGRFLPTAAMTGFPGIVHGGTIFTALDCLSTWVAMLLGPNPQAGWVLRSANAVYQRPASADEPLSLVGWVMEKGGAWDPLTVHAEARRDDGVVCVEGDFKVVPLSAAKLAAIAGLEHLPENWSTFLSRAG